MTWEVLYDNWEVCSSDKYTWADLDSHGVVRVTIIFSSQNRVLISGWDVYCVQESDGGLRVTYWKDEEPGDPYYGRGRSRLFLPDESNPEDTGYVPMNTFFHIMPEFRKRGRWVTDSKKAKEMGLID